MARPKLRINPKSGIALKKLCNLEKITQKELAKEISISPQAISEIVNGRARLTEYVADAIVSKFPGYRAAWLLGEDDFPTEYDVIAAQETAQINKYIGPKAALSGYLLALGYKIISNESGKPQEGTAAFEKWAAEPDRFYIKQLSHVGYSFIECGEDSPQVLAKLGLDDWDKLADDVFDFVKMKLLKLSGRF